MPRALGLVLAASCGVQTPLPGEPTGVTDTDTLGGTPVPAPTDSPPPTDPLPPTVPTDLTTDPATSGTPPPAGPSLVEADPLPAPEYPDVIEVVGVTVRTAVNANSDTDANTLSLCLNATACFELTTVGVDPFELGAIDVFTFEDVGLARSAVDRVELRSVDGTDRWEASCLSVLFDGERVHLRDEMEGTYFGNEPGELASWIDPEGLHLGGDTCWPSPLTHGPVRGFSTPTSFSAWVRTDGARDVGLRMSESADPADGPVVAWARPDGAGDGTATLKVDSLWPGVATTWWVEVDGVPMTEPALFQAPTDDVDGFTLAMGSCADEVEQPVFDAIEELSPDAFFFLGDNHYANSNVLDTLRWYYRWSIERPDRGRMMGAIETLAIWDDHDYVGNDTDAFDPGGDVALRAFREFWPNPGFGLGDTGGLQGVYFETRRGDVALFGVDDRTYRGTDGMLGTVQEDWLVERVLASDATFKVIASGSQWTAEASGDAFADFPVERARLFGRLSGVTGLVLLSGDIHRSELRMMADPGVGYEIPELTASPLANSRSTCPGPTSEVVACYGDANTFIVADFTLVGLDPTLTATIRDEAGGSVASMVVAASELMP